jgi:hypothetical protein
VAIEHFVCEFSGVDFFLHFFKKESQQQLSTSLAMMALLI